MACPMAGPTGGQLRGERSAATVASATEDEPREAPNRDRFSPGPAVRCETMAARRALRNPRRVAAVPGGSNAG
jgi:hypothetical protein